MSSIEDRETQRAEERAAKLLEICFKIADKYGGEDGYEPAIDAGPKMTVEDIWAAYNSYTLRLAVKIMLMQNTMNVIAPHIKILDCFSSS